MYYFRDILGNESIITHLQTALRQKNVSHAYLINGEDGSGKLMIANAFACALQCDEGGIEPCGHCKSCMQTASGNHPDIFRVTHEKSIISVDEIREQINNSVDIKPYSGKYKVYIVDEAEKMNDAAQNSLLKTLEEPPEYIVILLLVNNENLLLSTIRSRCVQLNTKPLPTEVVKQYLMEHNSLPDYSAALSAHFSCGNLGKALHYASSDDFSQTKDEVVHIMKHLDQMNLSELAASSKQLSLQKEQLDTLLDLLLLWYRDVIMFKASQDANLLLYRGELSDINQIANKTSFENLECSIEAITTCRQRLKANCNPEVSLQLLFMKMKKPD